MCNRLINVYVNNCYFVTYYYNLIVYCCVGPLKQVKINTSRIDFDKNIVLVEENGSYSCAKKIIKICRTHPHINKINPD